MSLIIPLDQTASTNANVDALIKLTAEDMSNVNALILGRTSSSVDIIPELSQHLINSGGKRIRPMLTVATARMCGHGGEHHITLAASVEFMHTATLLHDDVVDQSSLRRGKIAARMLWGNEASVLVGDFLLGQAFKMMVDAGSLDALRILSDAAAVIAEGEVMQLRTTRRLTTTEDDYLAVINAKTAALFAAAAEVGGVISNRSRDELTALHSFGRNLGLAFQLTDDALDYSGNQAALGKTIGDDFREGKITLPVILAYRRANREERSFLERTLERNEQNDGDLEQAIGLIANYQAIDDAIARARHYGAIAIDALGIFPVSPVHIALADAVSFAINRSH